MRKPKTKILRKNSAELVVAHARWKWKRSNTGPSLSYGCEKNARKALEIAEEDLKIAGITEKYKDVISESLSSFSSSENEIVKMKIGDFECEIRFEKGRVYDILFCKEGSEVKSYINFSIINMLSIFKKDDFDISLHNSHDGFEIEARHYGPSILSKVIFQYEYDKDKDLSQEILFDHKREMVMFCWTGSREAGLQLGELKRACIDFNDSNVIEINPGPKKHSFVNYYARNNYTIDKRDFDCDQYGDKVPPTIKAGDDFFGFSIEMKIDFIKKTEKIIAESGLPELAKACSELNR